MNLAGQYRFLLPVKFDNIMQYEYLLKLIQMYKFSGRFLT